MTANQKTENYLNQLYADSYGEEQIVNILAYLTNKSRGRYTTEKTIRHYHNNQMIGVLIRKYDSIAFEQAKSDMNFNR